MFLAIQHTYTSVELGLFTQTPLSQIDCTSIPKIAASRELIPALDTLLKKNNLRLNYIAFIAANQGPGPFTTMRLVLATVNSIAYATKKPLIAVQGLEALLRQACQHTLITPHILSLSKDTPTIALLNAFNNDVYFGIQTTDGIEYGWQNHEALLHRLHKEFAAQPVRFIGNGATMFAHAITTLFGNQATIDNRFEYPTLEAIAALAIHTKDSVQRIDPVYLKNLYPQ